jgi:hypothetical protein
MWYENMLFSVALIEIEKLSRYIKISNKFIHFSITEEAKWLMVLSWKIQSA